MPTDGTKRRGILVGLDVLTVDDPTRPRPSDDAVTALDRLGLIGRPIVLAGHELFGRRLPETPEDRVAWVRASFGRDELDVHLLDESVPDRLHEPSTGQASERWSDARSELDAAWLLTARGSSVGPARRAGLAVILIGPRMMDGAPAVERADRDARDLLDAVSQLLTLDTFAASRTGA